MQYDNIESHGNQKLRGLSLGYIRVLHTVPDAPNVDVYMGKTLIAKNLSYKQYTAYTPIPQGTYEISLYTSGSTNSPIINYSINIEIDTRTTVAVVGTLDTIGFIAIPDYEIIIPLNLNETDIRFIHLSSNTPTVDIALSTGSIIFENVSFKERTLYKTVPSSKYTFQVRVAGTSAVALTIPDILLESKNVYTTYIIGFLDGTPELESLIIIDGFFI